jgi:pSer/pThr/pTyr-binding forkhead associated (FHA) protein
MPLRLRVLPSSRRSTGDGRGPTSERAVDFTDGVAEIRIGRRPDLELPLPFSVLSNVHARLVRGASPGSTTWQLEDLGSRNGTFLDGMRLPPGEKRSIAPGTRISLGHVDLVFEGPSAPPATGSEGTATIARRLVSDLFATGAETSAPTIIVVSGIEHRGVLRLEARDRPYIVGRVEGCDMRLPIEQISREHARFIRRWDGVFVSDRDSKNGVRVSGKIIDREQRVRDGDLIQIGPVSLRLFDPEDRYLRDFESRPEAARSEAASPAAAPTPGPDLHPAIAGALAAAREDEPKSPREKTLLNKIIPRRGAPVATLVAAIVLALIAAAVVALAFG